MNIAQLLDLHPKLHNDGHGALTSWAIGSDVLEYLDSRLQPGHRTMETGAGLSTLVFALHGCHHTAISPDGDEFRRLRRFSIDHGIDLQDVTLIESRSEFALPGLQTGNLDLFLIDGRHAFPSPFIDWFYGAQLLRVGGLMIVDDTQLWTGQVLVEFMQSESHWQVIEHFDKTSIFEKLDNEVHAGEWNDQPFILQKQS